MGTIEDLVIEKQSIELLSSMALQKAYQKYIEKTSMHQKDPEQTFEQLYIFLTDFEISPKLVYKAMTYLAFYFQVKATQTKAWSIHNLQQLLVCYAELYWKRVEGVEASQETKVVRLLQHMEISEGFKKMVSQTLKENAITISFFKLPFKLAA